MILTKVRLGMRKQYFTKKSLIVLSILFGLNSGLIAIKILIGLNSVSLFSILFGMHYLVLVNILFEMSSLINFRDVNH